MWGHLPVNTVNNTSLFLWQTDKYALPQKVIVKPRYPKGGRSFYPLSVCCYTAKHNTGNTQYLNIYVISLYLKHMNKPWHFIAIYLFIVFLIQKNKDCWGYVFNLKIFDAVRTSHGDTCIFCGVTHIKYLNLNTLRTSCNGVTHILH